MKSVYSILILFATSTLLAISTQAQDQPYIKKEFSVVAPGNLRVKISGGSISVSSQPGNKVRIELYIRKGSHILRPSDREAKEILEDFKIDITQSGNTVSAIVERKNEVGGWFSWFTGNDVSISCTAYVPQQMACVLNTSGGSIDLKGVTGDQELRTSGGSLNLSRVNGDTEARTSGGSINVDEFTGRLNAHTSGGSVSVNKARGDFDLGTSGGSIRINSVDGNIEASTSGGGIQATVGKLTKYLRLKTSGGSITASVPSGLGLDLNLRGNRVNTHLENFNGEADEDKVVGAMNGGGIAVIMSTSGGSVNLEYR